MANEIQTCLMIVYGKSISQGKFILETSLDKFLHDLRSISTRDPRKPKQHLHF